MSKPEHLFITPKNPYLACAECGVRIRRVHDAALCGCEDGSYNKRCGHLGVVSECPTWGAEGNRCICKQEGVEHLEHEPA